MFIFNYINIKYINKVYQKFNTMEEIWKEIEGFENYQVSNLGRIKRTSWSRNSPNGLMLKLNKINSGYLQVYLRKNKKHHAKLVHRLVAAAFILNPNNYNTVDHIDGNKENNTVNNLQWMSQKDNWNKYKNSDKFKETYEKIHKNIQDKNI